MLLALFITPFIAALVILLLPRMPYSILRCCAIALSGVPLAILAANANDWVGSQITYNWFSNLGIQFHLSVDILSLLFLFLTAVVIPVSLLAIPSTPLAYPNTFYASVLILQGLLIAFFSARDLLLFTVFWEAMLLPLYFIINIWGGSRRQAAALKFIIYMIAGSALLLAAVLALFFAAGAASFNFDKLIPVVNNMTWAPWLFAIFLLAFAVKTPLFPFHGWLPDAYYQAPISGTILLSAILSKAGIYGIARIGMEFFPIQLHSWSPYLLILAIVGVLYGALAAWLQNDFKRLLAYTSFSHVNFILAGLFIWQEAALSGALLQAFNHGITIAALFLVAGWLEERLRTTAIGPYSGVASMFPVLCWITLFFVLSAVALPGTNNFVGELLILYGLFGNNPILTVFLGLSVILSVVYMMRWMQKVYFESPTLTLTNAKDLEGWQLAATVPLIALVLWIGLYPAPILELLEPTAQSLTKVTTP